MNASVLLVGLAIVSLTVSMRQAPDRSVATANTEQRILAGGVAPPAVTISPVNPYTGDPAAAEQGKGLFRIMNCEGVPWDRR